MSETVAVSAAVEARSGVRSGRGPRDRTIAVWFVRLLAIGAAIVAVAGAVSAARGGTLTVMHVTDGSGAILTEAARFHGSAGALWGALMAVGLVVAAILLGRRGFVAALATMGLALCWLWLLWKSVAFAYYDVAGAWSWAIVALAGAAFVATIWAGFARRARPTAPRA